MPEVHFDIDDGWLKIHSGDDPVSAYWLGRLQNDLEEAKAEFRTDLRGTVSLWVRLMSREQHQASDRIQECQAGRYQAVAATAEQTREPGCTCTPRGQPEPVGSGIRQVYDINRACPIHGSEWHA